MKTNHYDNDEQRMMDEEYGKDLGGCLWGFVAALLALAAICCLILFAS